MDLNKLARQLVDPFEGLHEKAAANAAKVLEAAEEREQEHDQLAVRLKDARELVAHAERQVAIVAEAIAELETAWLKAAARGNEEEAGKISGVINAYEAHELAAATDALDKARAERQEATHDGEQEARILWSDLKTLRSMIADRAGGEAAEAARRRIEDMVYFAHEQVRAHHGAREGKRVEAAAALGLAGSTNNPTRSARSSGVIEDGDNDE